MKIKILGLLAKESKMYWCEIREKAVVNREGSQRQRNGHSHTNIYRQTENYVGQTEADV